jgi:CBS domain-containing protein
LEENKGILNPNSNLSQDHPKAPICCNVDSTMGEILIKVAGHGIHRIFVLDKDEKLIGVLSLCDIIGHIDFTKM